MRYLLIGAAMALAACTEPDSNLSANEAAEPSVPAVEEGNAASGPLPLEPDNRAGRAETNESSLEPPRPLPEEGSDACGASRYQYLVGRHRSEVPAKPEGATWRVTCTSCPITMDYSPARLNIFYDEETEVVEKVQCG